MIEPPEKSGKALHTSSRGFAEGWADTRTQSFTLIWRYTYGGTTASTDLYYDDDTWQQWPEWPEEAEPEDTSERAVRRRYWMWLHAVWRQWLWVWLDRRYRIRPRASGRIIAKHYFERLTFAIWPRAPCRTLAWFFALETHS